MKRFNIELKAKCSDPERIRGLLKQKEADFRGLDRQLDTYFCVSRGRLKLREGNIENSLIYYDRGNEEGPKSSHVDLYPTQPGDPLKEILTKSLGIQVVVDKSREIYFIDNVKFHIDQVEGLGGFVEIEAIDSDGSLSEEELRDQCESYLELFQIPKEDFVAVSYSDLLEKKSVADAS